MAKKAKRSLRWIRLDNAAKIYPAARRKNWSNVFRQSVTLFDDVDTGIVRRIEECGIITPKPIMSYKHWFSSFLSG